LFENEDTGLTGKKNTKAKQFALAAAKLAD
jgi:hypothetical protein